MSSWVPGVVAAAGTSRHLPSARSVPSAPTLLVLRWVSLTSSGELRTMGATECLDVYEGSTTPGAKVELWNCDGSSAQKWTLKSDGTVVAQKSGLCLDVSGAKTANGSALDVWTCNGGANQKWSRVYR